MKGSVVLGQRTGAAILICGTVVLSTVPSLTSRAQPPIETRTRVAQHAAPPISSTRDLIARLPASASLVVALDGGTRQRLSAPGRAVWSFVTEAQILQRTLTAWDGLASTLKLAPDAAFDELLGRRAVFVVTNVGANQPLHWALLSQVTPATEARIRESLSPAPRSVEGGRPILSLERGAFELATSAGRPGRVRVADNPTDEMILLAPAEDSSLFDELLNVLSGREVALALDSLPAWPHAKALGPGDTFVWFRGGWFDGERAPDHADEFFSASARLTERGWEADYIASAEMVIWNSALARPLPTGLRKIDRDAMLFHAGTTPARGAIGGRELTSLAALVIPGFPKELSDHLGPSMAFGVYPEAQGLAADAQPQLSISVAVSTDDLANTQAAGDEFLGKLISDLSIGGKPGVKSTSAFDFSKLAPFTPRTMERRGGPDGRHPPDALVAWSYTPACTTTERAGNDPGDRPGVDARAEIAPRTPGWWMVSAALGSGPKDAALRRLESLGALTGAEPELPLVSCRSVVRPALMVKTLNSMLPKMPPALRAMRWFELLESEAAMPHDGVVSGTIRLETSRAGTLKTTE